MKSYSGIEELGSVVVGRRNALEAFEEAAHGADHMALYQISSRKYLISDSLAARHDYRLSLVKEGFR